jgi:hypothetical protein
MAQIKDRNALAGHHYFSRDTMRFFNSRIPRQTPVDAEYSDDLVFFITSEQFEDSRGRKAPRYYHVRTFRPSSGDCGSGAGADYRSIEDARKAARHFSRGEFISGYVDAVHPGPFQTFNFLEEWNSVNQDYVEYANRQSEEIYLTQEMRR